jgi:hypothetical protein
VSLAWVIVRWWFVFGQPLLDIANTMPITELVFYRDYLAECINF